MIVIDKTEHVTSLKLIIPFKPLPLRRGLVDSMFIYSDSMQEEYTLGHLLFSHPPGSFLLLLSFSHLTSLHSHLERIKISLSFPVPSPHQQYTVYTVIFFYNEDVLNILIVPHRLYDQLAFKKLFFQCQ